MLFKIKHTGVQVIGNVQKKYPAVPTLMREQASGEIIEFIELITARELVELSKIVNRSLIIRVEDEQPIIEICDEYQGKVI